MVIHFSNQERKARDICYVDLTLGVQSGTDWSQGLTGPRNSHRCQKTADVQVPYVY